MNLFMSYLRMSRSVKICELLVCIPLGFFIGKLIALLIIYGIKRVARLMKGAQV